MEHGKKPGAAARLPPGFQARGVDAPPRSLNYASRQTGPPVSCNPDRNPGSCNPGSWYRSSVIPSRCEPPAVWLAEVADAGPPLG